MTTIKTTELLVGLAFLVIVLALGLIYALDQALYSPRAQVGRNTLEGARRRRGPGVSARPLAKELAPLHGHVSNHLHQPTTRTEANLR